MEVNIAAFASFIFITTFTPGPNNIMSASFGMLLGYQQTFKFLMGVVAGFFMILWLCALLSSFLLQSAPFINDYLKYIGATYIIWLAYQTLRASYSTSSDVKHLATLTRGFLLQLVNPKGLFYGMTIFTTFLAGIKGEVLSILPWTLMLAVVCFCAISTWTLFGNAIQKYMQNRILKQAINILFSIALVLTALQIVGIF